jgi:AcrR family transcriptional regulator
MPRTSTPRPPRTRLAADERRGLIEEAAARLFAEHGYAATTIEEIAGAAGVTKPMVYRHFDSKKALHMALLEKHRDELARVALTEYAAGDESLELRVAAMIDAWFTYVERHPYAWRLLFRDTTGDPDVQAFHHDIQAKQRAADLMLLRLQDRVPIPEAELEPLAEIVRSSLTGLALWWLDHPGVPRSVVVDAMQRVVAGILTPSTRPRAR